ncbi:MAG TPA: hypothetical protein VJ888_05005 [Mobilitalea sp.]|nr:hypothetical protein [Mobilitalea sp.]
MNTIMKFLLLAFGLMLTCVLVLYGSRVAKTGMDTSNTALDKINTFNKELAESDITMYDGIEVVGSDVVNFFKKHLGEYGSSEESVMYIHVITATDDSTYRNGVAEQDITNFTSVHYIKPNAVFKCDVIRDANDVIIAVSFAQR